MTSIFLSAGLPGIEETDLIEDGNPEYLNIKHSMAKKGIETIMELRRDFPDVKIIAISGGGHNHAEHYLFMARIFGVQRTFAKPIAREELLKAVRELLN
ncbi:MAG: hypothetical protein JRF31_05350 [Deltaproteobacteria bacterium]|nr:hypothetical protein [Deltaproteobacteria bacterium]MBW2320271.1 hypothetical protein [Deltaproteobacteria bacterium]